MSLRVFQSLLANYLRDLEKQVLKMEAKSGRPDRVRVHRGGGAQR